MAAKFTYWERVCSYRFDPFFTGVDDVPFPPSFLPWLFPTSRVWLAAFWSAWWDRNAVWFKD